MEDFICTWDGDKLGVVIFYLSLLFNLDRRSIEPGLRSSSLARAMFDFDLMFQDKGATCIDVDVDVDNLIS